MFFKKKKSKRDTAKAESLFLHSKSFPIQEALESAESIDFGLDDPDLTFVDPRLAIIEKQETLAVSDNNSVETLLVPTEETYPPVESPVFSVESDVQPEAVKLDSVPQTMEPEFIEPEPVSEINVPAESAASVEDTGTPDELETTVDTAEPAEAALPKPSLLKSFSSLMAKKSTPATPPQVEPVVSAVQEVEEAQFIEEEITTAELPEQPVHVEEAPPLKSRQKGLSAFSKMKEMLSKPVRAKAEASVPEDESITATPIAELREIETSGEPALLEVQPELPAVAEASILPQTSMQSEVQLTENTDQEVPIAITRDSEAINEFEPSASMETASLYDAYSLEAEAPMIPEELMLEEIPTDTAEQALPEPEPEMIPVAEAESLETPAEEVLLEPEAANVSEIPEWVLPVEPLPVVTPQASPLFPVAEVQEPIPSGVESPMMERVEMTPPPSLLEPTERYIPKDLEEGDLVLPASAQSNPGREVAFESFIRSILATSREEYMPPPTHVAEKHFSPVPEEASASIGFLQDPLYVNLPASSPEDPLAPRYSATEVKVSPPMAASPPSMDSQVQPLIVKEVPFSSPSIHPTLEASVPELTMDPQPEPEQEPVVPPESFVEKPLAEEKSPVEILPETEIADELPAVSAPESTPPVEFCVTESVSEEISVAQPVSVPNTPAKRSTIALGPLPQEESAIKVLPQSPHVGGHKPSSTVALFSFPTQIVYERPDVQVTSSLAVETQASEPTVDEEEGMTLDVPALERIAQVVPENVETEVLVYKVETETETVLPLVSLPSQHEECVIVHTAEVGEALPFETEYATTAPEVAEETESDRITLPEFLHEDAAVSVVIAEEVVEEITEDVVGSFPEEILEPVPELEVLPEPQPEEMLFVEGAIEEDISMSPEPVDTEESELAKALGDIEIPVFDFGFSFENPEDLTLLQPQPVETPMPAAEVYNESFTPEEALTTEKPVTRPPEPGPPAPPETAMHLPAGSSFFNFEEAAEDDFLDVSAISVEGEAMDDSTEEIQIVASAPLVDEFQLLLVHHEGVYALMVDNGDNSVILKAFDTNPLVAQDAFSVTEEAIVGNKIMYIAQVGLWQGIVSVESDEVKLQAEI